MAGPGDPFTPGQTSDLTAGLPDAETFDNIKRQWMTFMDQPGARSALLQAGIALMQPPGFGQTPAGHIGQALGAGAMAVSAGEAQKAKMEAEKGKGEIQAAKLGQAADRLGLEYYRRQSIERGQALNRDVQWRKAYQADKANIQKQYQQQLKNWQDQSLLNPKEAGPKPVPPPDLGYDEWLRQRGMPKFGTPSGLPAMPGLGSSGLGSSQTEEI